MGYGIIEPASLDSWLYKAKNQAMQVALLTWVQHRLSAMLIDEFPALHLEVIKVQYISTYPALGIRGGDLPDNLPERLDTLTKQILSNSSVNDFLDFALDDQIDWDAKAQEFFNP